MPELSSAAMNAVDIAMLKRAGLCLFKAVSPKQSICESWEADVELITASASHPLLVSD